jgi:hypothetical protein
MLISIAHRAASWSSVVSRTRVRSASSSRDQMSGSGIEIGYPQQNIDVASIPKIAPTR